MPQEHRQVVEWCIAQARGRVPVIAGAGSNNTQEAIELARHALGLRPGRLGAGGMPWRSCWFEANEPGMGH